MAKSDARFDQARSLMEFLETFLGQAEQIGITQLPISITNLREICTKLQKMADFMEEYENALKTMIHVFDTSEGLHGIQVSHEWAAAATSAIAEAKRVLKKVKVDG